MAESKGNDRRARKMLAGLGDLPGRLLVWLGGLDSNQDNQIQNLMYCQLYDLPTGGKEQRSDGGMTP